MRCGEEGDSDKGCEETKQIYFSPLHIPASTNISSVVKHHFALLPSITIPSTIYRVFGHFEKPLFMTLCKHVETKFVPAGALLFRPGQVDDSIYVVKSGRLSVFIVEQVRSFALCKHTRTCVVCLQARHGYGKHHYQQCHITICFASTCQNILYL